MNIFKYLNKKGIDTIDSSFYALINVWDSWYKGNVEKFHNYRIYQGAGNHINCRRKSLGMAKRVCEDVADLLLNEKVKITISDTATSKFVNSVMKDANFSVCGNEYQERKAAYGTVAYVPYITDLIVDEKGNATGGRIRLDYVVARNIYPTAWENGRIIECIFVFEKVYKKKKYAHLQHHYLRDGQYVIENTVVESKNSLGKDLTPQEWNDIPFFKGLAHIIETGSDKPQFVIDKLNIANNVDSDASNPMGMSVFANSVDTLASMDLKYDSYANEFSLGRKRIFAAPELLKSINGDTVFDENDTVFYMLPEDFFKNTNQALQESNMELRVDEHEKAINNDLNLLSLKCGLGTQYYRFERGNIATATQVISENSDLYRAIKKHEIVLEKALKDLIRTIVRLGIAIGTPNLKEDTDIIIDFDDSIIEDRASERQQDRQDVSMGVMSLEEYRAKWYGETEEEAKTKIPDQSGGVMM